MHSSMSMQLSPVRAVRIPKLFKEVLDNTATLADMCSLLKCYIQYVGIFPLIYPTRQSHMNEPCVFLQVGNSIIIVVSCVTVDFDFCSFEKIK